MDIKFLKNNFQKFYSFFYIHPKKFFFNPGFFYLMGGGIKNTGN
jgi:hypothetical protein